MVVSELFVATNTMMLSPAVTLPVVLTVADIVDRPDPWPRSCTKAMLAAAGAARTALVNKASKAANGTTLKRRSLHLEYLPNQPTAPLLNPGTALVRSTFAVLAPSATRVDGCRGTDVNV